MRRRDFLTRSLTALAAPLVATDSAGATVFAAAPSEPTATTPPSYSSRVKDLVAQSGVIDMLGLLTLDWERLTQWQQTSDGFTAEDFRKLRQSGIDVFHPAVAFVKPRSYDVTHAWLTRWNQFIAWHPDFFLRVDSAQHLATARQSGKIGIILGMQDANHFRTLDDVNEFHSIGQRLTQLTYNGDNLLGSGCKATRDKGLTPFGADVVSRMNAIGMAIDISHCGQRTSLDAISASKKPVLITHSNCRALAPGAARCKGDAVIQAAARQGGVLGITSVRQFVRDHDPVTMEDVLDHFDHAAKLVGVEHVGVGSDFDLDAHPTYDIAGLNHVNRIYALTDGLFRRGYTDAQVALMLGGNFARALKQIWS